MARRHTKKSAKEQGAIIAIAAIIALVVFIVKIILVLLPFIVLAFLGYKYYQWQSARLLFYNNDWNKFYHEELKHKLHLWVSSLAIAIGLLIAFLRPWAGIPIALVGLLTFPKIQNLLIEKFQNKYNNWTKGTIIASLLTVSFAANGVYTDTLNKQIAEKKRLEKIKSDEIEQAKRDKQIKIDSANYFVQLASKNIKDKKYNTAEGDLHKAIDLDSQNQNAFYYRGVILQNKGKYSNALEEYDKVTVVSELEAGELQYQKGQCYINIGKKEEALTAFQTSGNLGFEKGNRLYEKYKPKPETSTRISKSGSSPAAYSSGGSSRRSGDCLAGLCTGYTKKGYRCSRTTKSCSGRCWQH